MEEEIPEAEGEEAAADPELSGVIVIIVKIKILLIQTRLNKAKRLTREAPKPAQMSQVMPVPATGRKAVLQLTAPIHWCAAGPTSLSLENEILASLTK